MCNKKIWGFILTMWYVNAVNKGQIIFANEGFILTMWYVNSLGMSQAPTL